MVKKIQKAPSAKKRIWNPVTGSYYQIRQKTTSAGKRGTIVGRWSPPKTAKRSK